MIVKNNNSSKVTMFSHLRKYNATNAALKVKTHIKLLLTKKKTGLGSAFQSCRSL